MRSFSLKIDDNYSGREIKYILKNYFGFSDRLITKLKKGDNILLNGKKEYVIKTVSKGDLIEIILPEENSDNIVKENIPLEILYEDDDVLAVNKPPNMPTHPSISHFTGTLANAVMYYFRKVPFTFRAVTRLDRDTSGVVIIAKNPVTHQRLFNALTSGNFQKEYVALTQGVPSPRRGIIEAPIMRECEGIIKRKIDKNGKPAFTEYEVIDDKNGFALIKLHPKTGRTHQLRLHLAHIGTPIFADFLYGDDVENERIRLHCGKVSFKHPFDDMKLCITAPLPDDMLLENFKEL